MNEQPPCECPVAGWCARYKRTMGERLHNICRGKSGLADWKELHYRTLWLSQADSRVAAPPVEYGPADFPCLHRALEVLEIGKCNLCGMKGQPFNVFACAVHGRCSVGKRRDDTRSCIACADRTGDVTQPVLTECIS